MERINIKEMNYKEQLAFIEEMREDLVIILEKAMFKEDK